MAVGLDESFPPKPRRDTGPERGLTVLLGRYRKPHQVRDFRLFASGSRISGVDEGQLRVSPDTRLARSPTRFNDAVIGLLSD
jgi:hypothetical protein